MYQQHVADFMHLMVEAGISLPMGEDWLVQLIFCCFSQHSVSHFRSFCRVLLFIHSLLLPLFLQSLQEIHLANHICSIAELLHSDAMLQLEVALLGSSAAKLLDILSVGMQCIPSTQHQSAPLDLKQYLYTH